jgi:hypothetical protein
VRVHPVLLLHRRRAEPVESRPNRFKISHSPLSRRKQTHVDRNAPKGITICPAQQVSQLWPNLAKTLVLHIVIVHQAANGPSKITGRLCDSLA